MRATVRAPDDRAGKPHDPFVTASGQLDQSGDRPTRQRRLLKSRAALNLGNQPVVVVDRVDRLGRCPLLALTPELDRAQTAQEGRQRKHQEQSLRPPPSHMGRQANRSGCFGQWRKARRSTPRSLRRFQHTSPKRQRGSPLARGHAHCWVSRAKYIESSGGDVVRLYMRPRKSPGATWRISSRLSA